MEVSRNMLDLLALLLMVFSLVGQVLVSLVVSRVVVFQRVRSVVTVVVMVQVKVCSLLGLMVQTYALVVLLVVVLGICA